jgi:SagB-type dehydrogenase family enzyme
MSVLSTVFAYHERTKHHFHRYARSPGYLDWANQPQPFRYYHGSAETCLASDRKPRALAYDRIYEPDATAPARVDLGTLADFFRYSLALTAWKQSGTSRWSLRVNPSSGNLHPTEAYVLLESTASEADSATLYHYVSEKHCLERRASFSEDIWNSLMSDLPSGSFLLGLSSVIWREAWKYGERAFRYCQHDMGHAVAALRLSAVLCGWRLKLVSTWSMDDVATLLGLNREDEFLHEEPEESELLAVVMPNTSGANIAAKFPPPSDKTVDLVRTAQWYGQSNRLSREHVAWPVIAEVSVATRMPQGTLLDATRPKSVRHFQPSRALRDVGAEQIIHQRRSCLALDGRSIVSEDVFLHILGRTLPGPHPPWDALYWPTTIHLALFVHRVNGFAPGLYLLVRDPDKKEQLKQAMRETFAWQTPPGVPTGFPLYLLIEADCRDAARALSCHQEIAADGFFSLGMIAEFRDPVQKHGAWFYRNLFWEAGMIGQVLYLEAEAAGVRSTGIGCYFDDPVHEVLGLTDNRFQSLYHFTVGVPVEDHRLQTWSPYLEAERKT